MKAPFLSFCIAKVRLFFDITKEKVLNLTWIEAYNYL
nr:MAG TPA: hypothetical protein [Caudoviricetes sp.]